MINIRQLKVENVLFEYITEDRSIYIFNTNNDRMVKTTDEMIEYLEDYQIADETNDPAVDKFIFDKRKKRPFELKFARVSVEKRFFSKIFRLFDTLYFRLFMGIAALVGFVLLPLFLADGATSYMNNSLHLDWKGAVMIYLGQLIITTFHELGHYYYYQKYINSEKFRFGILLRYFFLFLFYTNVNFIDRLPKKQQIKILFAGVQVQASVNGVLLFIMLFVQSPFLLSLFFINLINIIINLVPFLKTDGYWVVNLMIGSDDYMRSFKNWITRKKTTIKFSELLFSTINIICIAYILFSGSYQLIRLIF
ncbi:hypothetical protein CKN80_07825 [Carnobacterium divergens]|uniref:hypothetical protein n=1 Tax=Carnobacterium divergens TaxID=2748 RepID=UPI00107160FA|nr:hypothetical protein [Carnobacterium divergens]TFJ44234.1 hypothetical protein CKN79_09420 [Carnobacterium divergens]TFJ50870.1 hypothetical protein CKN80_07825 [Carnobacterium divergens]